MKPLDPSTLASLPLLPRDADGPVFAEPWEAQAFALTLQLYEAGCFSWSEWAECLSDEIRAAQQAGDPDLGDTYYLHWLSALERLTVQKDLVDRGELLGKREAWATAASSAEHGEPIRLNEEKSA